MFFIIYSFVSLEYDIVYVARDNNSRNYGVLLTYVDSDKQWLVKLLTGVLVIFWGIYEFLKTTKKNDK